MVHRFDHVKMILSDSIRFSSKIIPTAKSPFFVLMDGDEHKRIRSIVTEILSPKHLAGYEDSIKNIVQSYTEKLIQKGSAELFESWADKIPLHILAYLFGLDHSESALNKLHNDNLAINRALFVTGGTGPRRKNFPTPAEVITITLSLLRNSVGIFQLFYLLGWRGMRELISMFKIIGSLENVPRPDYSAIPQAIGPLVELMIHFSKSPGKNSLHDPLGIFRKAINTGEATKAEMVMAGAFILFAGYETTSSLLSNCFVHLAKNNNLFQQLKLEPRLTESFIEESLRMYTPVGRFLRKTTCDVEIDGVLIPENSVILVMLGAANTDDMEFSNGCEFDINRINSRKHMSFGKGKHFCPGASLARMVTSEALQALVRQAKNISIDTSHSMQMVTGRDNGILRYEKINCYITV